MNEEGESEWDEMRFELMWLEHGGSGLGMAFAEVNEIDFADIAWLVNRAREQRHREVAVIKNAARKR